MGKLENKEELIAGVRKLLKSDLKSRVGKYCSKWKVGYQEEYPGSGLPVISITIQNKAQNKEDLTVYINLNGHLFISQVDILNVYELNKLYELVQYIRNNNKYSVNGIEVMENLEKHFKG